MTEEKSKKKILMVDDDRMLLKLYEMAVESHADEFQLITAENTVDADKIARAQKPDIILLDLILGKEPETSVDELDKSHGFNFLLALKADDETKEIPVVIFSNLDTRKDDEKARSLGAVDYLVKARMLPEEVTNSLRETIGMEEAKKTIRNLSQVA
jgi:two-component system alkaline phosphatase synthesis response regulator PhoP